MEPWKYFMGRSLQLAGLVTITFVVFLFFTQMKMGDLLYLSLAGAASFYGGTWLLGQG